MSTIIYLIRHGEVFNPDGILYGRLPNFGLSETGKKQIEETANFLKDKKIDTILSSPLLRAQQTAEVIKNKLGITHIQTTAQINEVKTSYQGQKNSTLNNLQSEIYLKPLDPSDETVEQIAVRMKQFIDETVKNYPEKHIVACSHGDPIMILRFLIEKEPLDLFSFKTDHYV